MTSLEILFQMGSSGFSGSSFLLAFAGYKIVLHLFHVENASKALRPLLACLLTAVT